MEVFSMGFKNMFKKSSKLFNKDGFYIILFICLCIVAITAVTVSRMNVNKKLAQEQVKVQERPEGTDYVVNDIPGSDNTTPTMNSPLQSNTAKVTEKKTNENAKDDQKTSSTSTVNSSSGNKEQTVKEVFKISLPVEGEITKKFDKEHLQKSISMEQWETHEGIDIACDIGTEIKSAYDGTIADVFNDDRLASTLKTGLGMTVVIEHKGGYQTIYSNLAENVVVKKGDSVKKGQVIGNVGDTSTREVVSLEGSHLHFVVLKKSGTDMVTVNPQDYLK
jgi:murein DD-endopeptidase MepM/ murein hydrolase activator NlpD